MVWCYFDCPGFSTGVIIHTNKFRRCLLKQKKTGSGEWGSYRESGPLSGWWIVPPAGWREPGCRGWNLLGCQPQTWRPGTPGRPERGGRPGQRRRAGGWGRVSGFCSGGGGRHVTFEMSYQGILFSSCLSKHSFILMLLLHVQDCFLSLTAHMLRAPLQFTLQKKISV